MGRLWDNHFRDLGYPPKFQKGQDAGVDAGSVDRTMVSPNSVWSIAYSLSYGIPRWVPGMTRVGFGRRPKGCGVGVTHTLTRAGREGPGDHRACSDVKEEQCSVFCVHRTPAP